jgi:hypothetical protein
VPSAAAVDGKAFKRFRQSSTSLLLECCATLPWMGTCAAKLSANVRVARDEPAGAVPRLFV